MVVAAISEVKARLSELLAGVRDGEEVVITDRGRPVARLSAITDHGQRLEELQRRGVVRGARRSLTREFLDRPRGTTRGADTLSALLEDRRQGR